ncbi:hypothetical protein O6H91_17G065600 [Diphasiastrum complanatum]|uniref:Uncharacterized protein n=2 Tax=Diphasiastrum complanatum TaxID=34168 RepID=A0ACC2B7Q2_DIPCM|nr:hypothetical protein O6H91_17G065600 [Diphasiastrum complanatum]KAJ7525774.1 hypothetical protein O6H91_17G065600 [Diphasiastrum complanatum]
MAKEQQCLIFWSTYLLLLFFYTPTKAQLFPAFFILGDSLVDNGNNNFIGSLAVADIPFNGIDFVDRLPTGRFCNGRTVADLLAESIGLPPAPPFLSPLTRGSAILKGVNFASGAGGILDSTGANYINRISFNKQLEFFRKNKQSLIQLIGDSAANSLLQKSLYFIVFGSNDYINNYLLSDSPTRKFTPSQYQDLLVSTFRQQLTTLYNLGARKVVISAVGPLGCIPSQINQRSPSGACVQFINNYVVNFNAAVKSLLNTLNQQLPGAVFNYGDSYNAVLTLINNPATYGFTSTNTGCCGVGRFNGQLGCTPISNICPNRKNYIFWDPFHPTEASNLIFAPALFSGNTSAISPFNIQQLARLP